MAKTYYSEYVQHCMRFYARHPKPDYFRSDIDKENWQACDRAMKSFTEESKDTLLYVYREADTIADNVYQIAKKKSIKQDSVWKLMGELERLVAKKRGLI